MHVHVPRDMSRLYMAQIFALRFSFKSRGNVVEKYTSLLGMTVIWQHCGEKIVAITNEKRGS